MSPAGLYEQNKVAMKPILQRKGIIAQAGKLIGGTNKVKKATNRQKKSTQKASEVLSQQLSVSEASTKTRKEVTTLELKSGKVVDPSTKIKLQLFPVDEVTRIGLEKDALNPFLELTLRARKKISSVINHIHTKWGASSIAIGEPMLLPYESHLRQHTSITTKWTSKDTSITAGDVYTALETPPVFRLSYGWFSDDEPSGISPRNCVTSETIQKHIETTEEKKLLEATAEIDDTEHVDEKVNMGQSHERSTSPWDDELTNLSIGGLVSEHSVPQKTSLITDISIGGLLSEASLQGKLQPQPQPQFKWDDSLTALSIGGLLSEASLQAKMNKFDPKSFISDSFDAIISSQQMKNDPQPQLSILDAEQTCNAFSFRKFSSSTKNVRVSVARATHDSNSNSFKFPGLLEGDRQAANAEDTSGPQQYNEDSRSLGLRGINWNESLGPFDLGNSMPWKI
ncbi:unnamed protein product [Lactuca saligna]|uniref:TSL-kinase interacting protein 1 n=1 Tax=Lactuca saligna TaxID=75948 RepID=A0AA35YY48_LACSI|nr:unnamed protein product [Lactuca saligna]